jgi:hypothetical protein
MWRSFGRAFLTIVVTSVFIHARLRNHCSPLQDMLILRAAIWGRNYRNCGWRYGSSIDHVRRTGQFVLRCRLASTR